MTKGIINYQAFVDILNESLQNVDINDENWKNNAIRCVDGLAADELRRLVDIETRRANGTFFTNSELAKKVLKELNPNFKKDSYIYDPACGAGNLIIAAWNLINEKKLKLSKGQHFLGTDIHKEFIEAAKLRCSINQILEVEQLSPEFNFFVADGLLPNEHYDKATHILVNPPFNLIEPNEKLKWSNGKVSAAALFIDKIVQNVSGGTVIHAILPDVLRSGSRYEKWRKQIEETCVIGKTKLLGQFDKYADVDVYAINLTKRKKKIYISQCSTEINTNQVISDQFDVCVGPVVDNRDARNGPELNYVVSRGLQGWTTQTQIDLRRQHSGKSFSGPFVVVKRTSRMGDTQRAIATIINSRKPVFVDNHLIVLKPKTNTLLDCRLLLENLRDKRTDDWLNEVIRCRHLTVKVVSKIPIW